MSLYRNFLNVGAMTLLSRLLGFARDIALAAVLGTGFAADAFVAAFRFPNLFRRLFAEGAFNVAFVPMFTGALEQQGPEAAREMATRIISWLVAFLLVLTVLAEIFMPQVMMPFVPGFLDDPEKFELTVLLTRICFPYLACMSLMAAYGGILNGLGKFLAAAFAPVLLNIVLVAVLVVLILVRPGDAATASIWVSIGVAGGGVAQLALVGWAVRATGFVPRFRLPRLSAEVRRFWMLALPAIAAGGVTQINIFVGTIIASGAAGAMSYLYYADRLYQLPLGIIGIAIGVVLLPELSRHLKADRQSAARDAFDRSLIFAMLLALPAAAGLIGLSEPIIRLLFERGAFGPEATTATAAALSAFACGLPAFILIKVLQPGFFAREDTMTPTLLAALSVGVNIVISLLLFPSLQHVGIAIATTVSAWINTAGLLALLVRRGHFTLAGEELRKHLVILAASLVLALGLWFAARLFADVLSGASGLWLQGAGLFVLIGLGALLYFAFLNLTGVQRFDEIIGAFRRRKT